MKRLITLLFTLLIINPVFAAELEDAEPTLEELLSAYTEYKDVTDLGIEVPTVVEIPFTEDINRYDFAVLETATDTFQASYFYNSTYDERIPVKIESNHTRGVVYNLNDGKYNTYVEYPLASDLEGTAEIKIISDEAIESSYFSFQLDNHVSLPKIIEIMAKIDDKDEYVLAPTKVTGTSFSFPQTISNEWTIKMTYIQPLRITEINLSQLNSSENVREGLRFLARPDNDYKIYFNPDRYVKIKTTESGNLGDNEEVLVTGKINAKNNPLYMKADLDKDGIPDTLDNCVGVENADQLDTNNNGRGDVCDDYDKDSIINSVDNCPDHPNVNQKDTDADGIGDACDSEESRITESNPWLPWAGMGIVGIVVIAMFASALRKK